MHRLHFECVYAGSPSARFTSREPGTTPSGRGRPNPGDMLRAYLIAKAQLLLLQDNPAEAEHIMRHTVPIDKPHPEPQITLAIALAMQGKPVEAVQIDNAATALLGRISNAS